MQQENPIFYYSWIAFSMNDLTSDFEGTLPLNATFSLMTNAGVDIT